METASVHILRYDRATGGEPVLRSFVVPRQPRASVMEALQHIYDHLDPTLAFRCGCRYRRCGICAAMIDGRPRLPCTTALNPETTIGPLAGMPVLRDLVVDRTWLMRFVSRWRLHLAPDDHRVGEPLLQSAEHRRVGSCTECFGCLATCQSYRHADEARGGPFHFLKLAQLHLDPRDHVDRSAQARALGIERCRDCSGCYCLIGIPVRRLAIGALLDVL